MSSRVLTPRRPEADAHHPSCCGACDVCLGICWGYHGPERRSEPTTDDRCHWCRRREVDTNVSLADGRIVGCCDTCWERGQDEIRIPLDYTEDEDSE